ncbi:sigma-70 family RNA polymerase sigma factor [Candidatus Wolfebacteria bacterium]|nr:sigma-70 family RNA polymerase sigma factor [Candidatus Wolfebacteria bacterium]
MKEYSDAELVVKYLEGDGASLEFLIKRYVKPIYGFVYKYVENAKDVEDITQDVFVKMWRNLKKPILGLPRGFNPDKGSFKTWIFQIAKNTAIDFLKKKKATPFSAFENEAGENTFTETLIDLAPLPQELLEKAGMAQMLNSVMEKLSPKYRVVLSLRYNDHLTFREIAESLGGSLNTVKSRHRRALVMLKNIFKKSA